MRRNIQIEDIGVMTAPRTTALPRASAPSAQPPVESAPTAPSRIPEIAPRAPGPSVPSGSTFEPRIPLPAPAPRPPEPTAPAPAAPEPTRPPPPLPPPMPVPSAQEITTVTAAEQLFQTAPVSQVPIKAPVVGVPAPRPIGTAKGGAPGVLKKPTPPTPVMAVASEATAAPEKRSRAPYYVVGGLIGLMALARLFRRA